MRTRHLAPAARGALSAAVLSLCFLAGSTGIPNPAHAAHRPGCSKDLKHRTPEQTIREHLALLQQGRLDEAICDYSEDAVVIVPNQVISGLDNIRTGLAAIGGLLGATVPTVTSVTTSGSVVFITFVALGSPCQIPDGADTYVVEKGQIVTQTAHDTFRSAPGATCPAAAPGT